MIPPATHALRFRIWRYANPRGWDCTIAEIAEAVGVSPRRVKGVISYAGWNTRVRSASEGEYEFGGQGRHPLGTYAAGRDIAADLIAGRIGVDA